MEYQLVAVKVGHREGVATIDSWKSRDWSVTNRLTFLIQAELGIEVILLLRTEDHLYLLDIDLRMKSNYVFRTWGRIIFRSLQS